MSTTPARVRLLLASAGVVVAVLLVGLALGPGTAVARATAAASTPAPTASPTPSLVSPQPSCLTPVPCASPSSTAEPTAEPTATATVTPTPTPTTTRTPSPTRTATRSPRPQATQEVPEDSGSLDNPVTGGGALGSLGPWTESPSAVGEPETTAVSDQRDDPLTRIVAIVLGLGVLLGLAGGTGLYVTRHRHDH